MAWCRQAKSHYTMMTSSNGNIFRVTGPLCGVHRSPVNSPHKGKWRGALMSYWSVSWINVWVNNHEAGDLRHHRAHYDVIVMRASILTQTHVAAMASLGHDKLSDSFVHLPHGCFPGTGKIVSNIAWNWPEQIHNKSHTLKCTDGISVAWYVSYDGA